MQEIELKVESAGVQLAGSLCLPEAAGPHPLVLMVHGTGPLDRDENMPGQALNVFNTIAYFLAGRGIASFRYDKRGCGKSGGEYLTAGHSDLVADAAACLMEMRRLPEVSSSQIFILGHSEGTLIAPQVAAISAPLAGLLLLCPFIQPAETLLLWQAETLEREIRAMRGIGGLVQRMLVKLLGGVRTNQEKLIARIKSGEEATFRSGQQPVAAKALRQLMALDPKAIFANVQTPMFLLGGGKDLQCDPVDVARIAEVAPAHTDAYVLEDLTHILRAEPGPASLTGSATLISEPVDARVLDLIGSWLAARVN